MEVVAVLKSTREVRKQKKRAANGDCSYLPWLSPKPGLTPRADGGVTRPNAVCDALVARGAHSTVAASAGHL